MALMQLVVEIQLFNVFCSIRYLNYNYYIMFVMNNKVKNTLKFYEKVNDPSNVDVFLCVFYR